ncbi:hypothetical protein ACIQVC_31475 [Streptomyces sp. NPDC101112]
MGRPATSAAGRTNAADQLGRFAGGLGRVIAEAVLGWGAAPWVWCCRVVP